MSKNDNLNNFHKILGFDLRSIALFRICIGICLISDLIFKATDLNAFYTDNGILPRSIIYSFADKWLFSLHFMSGGLWLQILLFVINLIFGILLILGYRTKLVTFICWVFLISLQNRNPAILNIGDGILRLIMFWAMFLPLNGAWSFDAVLNTQKENIKKYILSCGTIGYHIQIIALFVFAAILKTKNADWVNGYGVFYSLSQTQYTTPIGFKVLALPIKYLKLLNFFTIYFEMYGGFLLLIPKLRDLVLGLFFLMLIGFGLCLDLENVHWIMLTGLLPIIPSKIWDKYIPHITNTKISNTQLLFLKNIFSPTQIYLNEVLSKLPKKINTTNLNLAGNILAIFFTIYIIQWNLITLDERYRFPSQFNLFGTLLRLDQRWGMFIPYTKDSKWYGAWNILVGTTLTGETINLQDPKKQITFEKPQLISNTYKNYFWRMILSKNDPSVDKELFPYFGWYFCKSWNKKNPNKKIDEVENYFLFYEPKVDRSYNPTQTALIWSRFCLDDKEVAEDFLKFIKQNFIYGEIYILAEKGTNHLLKKEYKNATNEFESLFNILERDLNDYDPLLIPVLKILYRLYYILGETDNASWAKSYLNDIIYGPAENQTAEYCQNNNSCTGAKN